MEARRADEEAENEDIDTDDSDLEVVDDPRPADAEDDLGRLIIDAAAIEAPLPGALVDPPADGPDGAVANVEEAVSLEEQVLKVVERVTTAESNSAIQRCSRPDVLTQACIVYHVENISKNQRSTAKAFRLACPKQVRGYITKKDQIMALLAKLRAQQKSLKSQKSLLGSGRLVFHADLEKKVIDWHKNEIALGRFVRPSALWAQVRKV